MGFTDQDVNEFAEETLEYNSPSEKMSTSLGKYGFIMFSFPSI